MASPRIGTIAWIDLTVPDAARVAEFYRAVAGWRVTPANMGGYDDYGMTPAGADEPVAGVCHARAGNVGLPACWLIYITVAELDASLRRCRELGGEVIGGRRSAGTFGTFCVIRDPEGAYAALLEPRAPAKPGSKRAK